MVGFYPDVPAPRMPYDRDGTQVFTVNMGTGVVTPVSGVVVTAFNNESVGASDLVVTTNHAIAFLFPEERDLLGYYVDAASSNPSAPGVLEGSSDTTNGYDGTWTTIVSPWLLAVPGGLTSSSSRPNMRENIRAASGLGYRAIRFRHAGGANLNVYSVHLYGEIASGANPDRLAMWHPTLDEELSGAYLDWGDVPRSSSADKTFRVKNLSPTLTASTITVSIEALTAPSPAFASMHSFSTDGTTFTSSASIASLAPGAISGVLTVRRVVPSTAELSLWWARIVASALSWA